MRQHANMSGLPRCNSRQPCRHPQPLWAIPRHARFSYWWMRSTRLTFSGLHWLPARMHFPSIFGSRWYFLFPKMLWTCWPCCLLRATHGYFLSLMLRLVNLAIFQLRVKLNMALYNTTVESGLLWGSNLLLVLLLSSFFLILNFNFDVELCCMMTPGAVKKGLDSSWSKLPNTLSCKCKWCRVVSYKKVLCGAAKWSS